MTIIAHIIILLLVISFIVQLKENNEELAHFLGFIIGFFLVASIIVWSTVKVLDYWFPIQK